MTALLRAGAGLILWAAAFSILYAVQGLSCVYGLERIGPSGLSIGRAALILIYAASLAALAWLCRRLRPEPGDRDLLDRLAFTSAITGLVSTAVTGLPVLALSIC